MLRGFDIKTILAPATDDELMEVLRGFDKNSAAPAPASLSSSLFASASASSLSRGGGGVDTTIFPVLIMPADVKQLQMAGVFPLVATAGDLGCAVLVGRSAEAAAEMTVVLDTSFHMLFCSQNTN
jgi:hypothetical protein